MSINVEKAMSINVVSISGNLTGDSELRSTAGGTSACIPGKLRYTSWEKDDRKHSKIEVIVDDIESMRRRETAPEDIDEDIPF